MPDTLLESPSVLTMDTEAPDLMSMLSEMVTRVEREHQRLALSISTDLVEMLSVFDEEDRAEFWREFWRVIRLPDDALENMIQQWATTAQALRDPLRREILLRRNGDDDYVEVSRPE
jgi:hypothetical protein